jgi:hypothetical protein
MGRGKLTPAYWLLRKTERFIVWKVFIGASLTPPRNHGFLAKPLSQRLFVFGCDLEISIFA